MDGSLLLSGSEDQTARVWHVYSRQCLRVLNHRGNMNLLIGLQSVLALWTPHNYRHINNTYCSYTPRQKSYYTSLTKSISQCCRLSRRVEVCNKVFYGRLCPEVQPLIFLYTFLPEKVLLSYTFYPLDIPSLELHIAFKC